MNNHKAGEFEGFQPSRSTLCPGCDYDLRGLPTEHECPECGLTYDRETLVWTGRTNRAQIIIAGGIAVCGLTVMLVSGAAFGSLQWRLMALTYVAVIIFYGWIIHRKSTQRSFFALAGNEIICDGSKLHRLRIAFEDIDPINIDSQRRILSGDRFQIIYSLRSIDIRPFARTQYDRIKLMETIEERRRECLGLEPRE